MSGCAVAGIVLGALAMLSIPVIGIIAAIAVPNLLNAVQRGKQKRTMGDLRTIATAVESYSIDNNSYPVTDGPVPVGELSVLLSPTYIKALPEVDGWENAFVFQSSGHEYELKSSGKDGIWENPRPEGGTQNFNADIIFETGSFTAWPEGTQQ